MNLQNFEQTEDIDPPRAFEMTDYTFDLCNNFGMFRDFHQT